MPRYQKPQAYSSWHIKKLPAKCWYVDIDGVEIRKDRGIVAFFEFVETKRPLSSIGLALVINEKGFILDTVLFPISKAMKIPVYVVYHQKDCKQFRLFQFQGSGCIKEDLLSDKEYYELILNL